MLTLASRLFPRHMTCWNYHSQHTHYLGHLPQMTFSFHVRPDQPFSQLKRPNSKSASAWPAVNLMTHDLRWIWLDGHWPQPFYWPVIGLFNRLVVMGGTKETGKRRKTVRLQTYTERTPCTERTRRHVFFLTCSGCRPALTGPEADLKSFKIKANIPEARIFVKSLFKTFQK